MSESTGMTRGAIGRRRCFCEGVGLMEYIRNTTDFYIDGECALSLGKFDGIHRGHELLIERLAAKKEDGLLAAVFTFDVPPSGGAGGGTARVLTTNEEKRHIFEQLGVDCVVECPFTEEVRRMEAEDFVEKIARQLHARCIVVGSDFRFGHNRRGDAEMLSALAGKYGYELVVVEKMKEDARDISSTFVREEVAKGDIARANALLGYRYFVTGEVAHGNQIGRTIGIPTINQTPPREKLLPPNGVYLTEAWIGDRGYRGVTNVGCKPTVGGRGVGVETHLLDFAGDAYGKVATVEFIERVRDERKFGSIEELREQMQGDIAYARAYFMKNEGR